MRVVNIAFECGVGNSIAYETLNNHYQSIAALKRITKDIDLDIAA
jgi:hypothetical protein